MSQHLPGVLICRCAQNNVADDVVEFLHGAGTGCYIALLAVFDYEAVASVEISGYTVEGIGDVSAEIRGEVRVRLPIRAHTDIRLAYTVVRIGY